MRDFPWDKQEEGSNISLVAWKRHEQGFGSGKFEEEEEFGFIG